MGFALGTVVRCQIHDLIDLVLADRLLATRPSRTWANLTSPSSANRARQLLTDPGDTDNDSAIAVFARPSAAINNARARTTSRCGADAGRQPTAGRAPRTRRTARLTL
jgi:hypothetical protein